MLYYMLLFRGRGGTVVKEPRSLRTRLCSPYDFWSAGVAPGSVRGDRGTFCGA